jgi:dolichyl-phosphate-mannose-protein mannosyltransferase
MDWTTQKLNNRFRWGVYIVLYAAVIGLFVLFSPIVFGMQGSNKQWSHLKWFSTWRIVDS